jgi:hypothetical protein
MQKGSSEKTAIKESKKLPTETEAKEMIKAFSDEFLKLSEKFPEIHAAFYCAVVISEMNSEKVVNMINGSGVVGQPLIATHAVSEGISQFLNDVESEEEKILH